jgi:hypothetical protein
LSALLKELRAWDTCEANSYRECIRIQFGNGVRINGRRDYIALWSWCILSLNTRPDLPLGLAVISNEASKPGNGELHIFDSVEEKTKRRGTNKVKGVWQKLM